MVTLFKHGPSRFPVCAWSNLSRLGAGRARFLLPEAEQQTVYIKRALSNAEVEVASLSMNL